MSKSAKLLVGLFVYSLTAAVVLGVAAFLWLSFEFRKPGPLAEPAVFQVERGDGLSIIAQNLAAQNIIDDPYVFMIATRLMGTQSHLKAGEYEFEPGINARDVMYKIYNGEVIARRFTLREGLTSYEIVQILNQVEELEGEIAQIPAEGSLLPNTYDYQRGEKREQIIERLQNAMTETIDELWPRRAENLPIKTKEEAIILASIVEKETGVPSERKRVAGVFINRLRKGIALQTDPTIIYALTGGKPKNEGKGPLGRRLLKKDLEFDSPYNTYLHAGLPPGPIANPGRAAIEAVLQPEAHEFIYFVADGTGGHVFAKTLSEHNRNVAQWRKIRKQQGP